MSRDIWFEVVIRRREQADGAAFLRGDQEVVARDLSVLDAAKDDRERTVRALEEALQLVKTHTY